MVSKTAIRRSVPAGALPDFTPVPRVRPRHDGWTPERQRAFIEALADTGCVAIAARMVNMSQPSFYQLRRQPGAESFRAAAEAAQTLGLQVCKDEAFDRAMNGQLVPVFVAGKLMGFRRKKNDRLLMFILRHYGQDANGRKTTVNYFSTRASAASQSSLSRNDGEGDQPKAGGGAMAEASTTTVKTVISGPGAQTQRAADDAAANILNAFEGVELDPEAQAEIYRTLESCAERRRALENDPENDPDRFFIGQAETNGYLGELEIGAEGDWVEYRPEGEHSWDNLGEGGNAAEIDRVVSEIKARRAARTPQEVAAEEAEHRAEVQRMREEQTKRLSAPSAESAPAKAGEGPAAEPDPDDPRLDWRNWTDGGYAAPIADEPPEPHQSAPAFAREGERACEAGLGGRPTAQPDAQHRLVQHGGGATSSSLETISPRTGRPLKRYKKRTPKPAFTPPDEARKTEIAAEVEAERRVGAAAEAERRRRKKKPS